jgi:hypothetical protein
MVQQHNIVRHSVAEILSARIPATLFSGIATNLTINHSVDSSTSISCKQMRGAAQGEKDAHRRRVQRH